MSEDRDFIKRAESITAADLAGAEIAAQTAEAQAIAQLKTAEIGHPWEPEVMPCMRCGQAERDRRLWSCRNRP